MTMSALSHHVLFRLRTELDPDQWEPFVLALKQLVADLPQELGASAAEAVQIGRGSARRADWSFTAHFSNPDEFAAYLDSAGHQVFLATALPLCESILAIQLPEMRSHS